MGIYLFPGRTARASETEDDSKNATKTSHEPSTIR